MKSGKHQIIPSGISAILIYIVGIIIRFLLHIFLLFMFIIEAAEIFWLVNFPAQSILSVTFKKMVSFSIGLLVEFSILKRIIKPIGNIKAPDATLSRTKKSCHYACSLELLYFRLQRKYCVFYLGV